jgi:RNA polymerase sigma-70 factor (ECF subfamily)
VQGDPDGPLVARAAAGDRDAFTEIVERYQSRVYNLALTLGVRHADAEDVAQDVFIRVFRGLGRFRGDASFRSWLYQVTINAVRSHRAASRASPLVDLARPGDEDSPVPEPAVDDPFDRRLLDRQVIDRALAALPADWREAVTLRDVEGLSYAEIADLTGAPLGTVESRIFRARRQLRDALRALIGKQDRP